MHTARLTKNRPFRWIVEAISSYDEADGGVVFLGAASAENAQHYADWQNENTAALRAMDFPQRRKRRRTKAQ